MKKAINSGAGIRVSGFILCLMLFCALLSGGALAEAAIQISAAERQYMENGIVLTLGNVPENSDFAVSVRSPRYVTDEFGHMIEHWDFEIRVARENGELSFSHEAKNPHPLAGREYPHAAGVSSAVTENGDLQIHIELDKDHIGITGKEWPLETVVWEREYRNARKGKTAGSFVLVRYPEGVAIPEPQDLTGGWKVLSASDGQSYDDFWFDENEVMFRRHDALGNPYYAPRRIVQSNAPFYASDRFTWRILEEDGSYVLTKEDGVKLVCQKTDETADDFRLPYMTEATPPFVALFGHKWHLWDSDLMFNSDSFIRFYEDVVVYSPKKGSAVKDTTASDIRYEADDRMRVMNNGEEGTLYEWTLYGTSLYRTEIKDGIMGPRLEYRAYETKEQWLRPAPTAEPTGESRPAQTDQAPAAPTPSPQTPATPEITKKPRSSITFKGSAPNSSFANYSTEELPRFRVTLWSDGTGELEEHYMEEAGFYNIKWSWEGNTLCTQDSTNSPLYTAFHNGKGTYDFYGTGVQVSLPAGAEDFFREALGSVPDGVASGESDSASGQAKGAATAGQEAASVASEGLMWPSIYYNFSANRGYYYSSEDYYEGKAVYEKPSFAFYDLDGDGNQEMLGFNGYPSHADATCYAYSYEGEMISFLGIAGGEPGGFYYLEQDQYPGLFYSDGGMGQLYFDYITVEKGKLVRERVFETEEGSGQRKNIQKTSDDALFRIASSDLERHELTFITAEDLLKMGWDRYLIEVLHINTGSSQTESSAPTPASETAEVENKNPAPVWEPAETENKDPAAVWEPAETENKDPAAVWEPAETENKDPAAVWEPAYPVIPGTDGLKQVPVQSATATSYIGQKKGDDTYAPFRMIDGQEETCFQFRTSDTKLGKEYLYFTFSQPVTIDELWIKNGFWRITDGHDQYDRNSRVKVMTIDYLYEGQSDYSDGKKITLKDDKKRKDWKKLDLGHKENVTAVRFLIQKVYTGSKFKKDVCISEVMFVQK